MILRIFATDGHTPERIFRWSVEETAEHLCAEQVLWVTRLDGPWKGLVDWFVKQPCCRAVVLDTADRWDWYEEHEVTCRIAQGLYFQYERMVDAVCWIHDDMAPPTCNGFKEYLKEWLWSESTALEAPCYQLWDSFDSVRVDRAGLDFAGDRHCWLAKWHPDLRWLRRVGEPVLAGDATTKFRPVDSVDPWQSSWPFRHAKGVERGFREHRGFTRRGFPVERWRDADGVRCAPYNPEATWEEFKAKIEA